MNQKKDSALSLHFGAKHWSVLLYTILLYFVTAIITGTVQITAPGLAELRQWDYAALIGLNSVGGLANLMISMTIQVFGPASYPSVNRVMSPLVIAIRTLSFVVVGVVYDASGTYSVVSWVITGLLVISFICLCLINGATKPVPSSGDK